MGWGDLLWLAVSLSMDGLAVALAVGFASRSREAGARHPFRLGLCFGACQSLTVTIGWLGGMTVRPYVAGWAAWVAFSLLVLRGGRMLSEALHDRDGPKIAADPTRGWSLLTLSVATSIDGLVVGLPLAALGVRILVPAAVIGAVVAVLTAAGAIVGDHVGVRWGRRAEIAGGFGLCAIGTKILVASLAH